MVVRTNDPALTATAATACRNVGLNFQGNVRVVLVVTEKWIKADPADYAWTCRF